MATHLLNRTFLMIIEEGKTPAEYVVEKNRFEKFSYLW